MVDGLVQESASHASRRHAVARPLRSLQVVEASVGGVRRVLEQLVATLVERGHAVTVAWSPGRGAECEEAAAAYARAGARLVSVPMPRSPVPWRDVACTVALWRHMQHESYDLVHCHSTKAGVLGRLAARWAQVPVCIYSPHSFAFFGARQPLAAFCGRSVERAMLRFTDVLLAVSAFEAREARRLGMPSSLVETIPNGTRVQARAEPRASTAEPVIGAAGRLVRQKGMDVVVKAMAAVRARHPGARLDLAGDGPDRRRLARLAAALGVPVTFRGRMGSLDGWFGDLDLFVHAARWESLPLVILEAMSHGVPVVATSVGGVPEVIDRDTGYLVSPDDPGAVAAAIDLALTAPADAVERARRAHARIEAHHDVERAMSAYVGLYERAVRSRR